MTLVSKTARASRRQAFRLGTLRTTSSCCAVASASRPRLRRFCAMTFPPIVCGEQTQGRKTGMLAHAPPPVQARPFRGSASVSRYLVNARKGPVSETADPTGKLPCVKNFNSNDVSIYGIEGDTVDVTLIGTIGTHVKRVNFASRASRARRACPSFGETRSGAGPRAIERVPGRSDTPQLADHWQQPFPPGLGKRRLCRLDLHRQKHGPRANPGTLLPYFFGVVRGGRRMA